MYTTNPDIQPGNRLDEICAEIEQERAEFKRCYERMNRMIDTFTATVAESGDVAAAAKLALALTIF